MTVALAPSLAEFVHAKVATGDYASESEVVSESLRILAACDAEWKERVSKAIDDGMSDLQAGRVISTSESEDRMTAFKSAWMNQQQKA